MLARAALPEGAERLAISLDDPREGPFVIVTREGRFVTCLAKGMLIDHALVVLPRVRLDAAIAKVERMRERIALVETLRSNGGDGIAGRLFAKMFSDGLRFCREDAETLLQVWPLVGKDAVVHYDGLATLALSMRDRVAALRFDRPRPNEVEFAAKFGCVAWGAAHLVVLASASESAAFFEEAERRSQTDLRLRHARTLFELGSFAHATRVLWSLARRPQPIAPLRSLRTTDEFESLILRELGLAVIALRSSKHRAEAIKEISRVPQPLPPDATPEMRREHSVQRIAGRLGDAAREAIEKEKAFNIVHLRSGKHLAALRLHAEERPTQAMIDAIPDGVGRAAMANFPSSWFGARDDQVRSIQELISALPWLARAEPAELFLPRAYVERLEPTRWLDVVMMMEPYAKHLKLGLPAPVKAAATPGRNDVCSCGSGKKYKRCCG